MNVLLPEIKDEPKRKPAAAAFNKEVEKEIDKAKAKIRERQSLPDVLDGL